KRENGRRSIDEAAQRLAAATADRLRTGKPARCQMLYELEKKRQIIRCNAFLVQRENEEACSSVQEEVGILNAFGNPLVGEQGADTVACEELLQLLAADIGIHGHCGKVTLPLRRLAPGAATEKRFPTPRPPRRSRRQPRNARQMR